MSGLRGRLSLDEPLSRHTAWGIGGPADRLYQPADLDDLCALLRRLPADEPVFIVELLAEVDPHDRTVADVEVLLDPVIAELEMVPDELVELELRLAHDDVLLNRELAEVQALLEGPADEQLLAELRGIGIRIALDDFGSGLASYSYLKELPVDWLKIDGVFVRDIVNDREDYAVVKSINDIGHFLGKQTIAEYVKDRPTLELVREIGVDFAQGFGISPPMLLDDLLPYLAEQTVAQGGGDVAGRVTG